MSKYQLVNYIDTWHTEDGWHINELFKEEIFIHLSDYTNEEEILNKLIDAEYLRPSVVLDDLDFWNDYNIIEIYNKINGEPICRLELVQQ